MQFSHFTNEPLEVIRSTEQKPRYDDWSEYEKPRGFWVSVDGENDWLDWCTSESFDIGSRRYRIQLDLSRVLVLPDPSDLLTFTERYGRDVGRYGRKAIDWRAVSDLHAGIVIAPYHWSCRLDERTSWYYGWDCASGCIWDATAVTCVGESERAAA